MASTNSQTEPLMAQAQAALGQNNPRAALALLKQVLKIEPDHPGAWQLLYSLYGQGRPFGQFRAEMAAQLLSQPQPDLAGVAPAQPAYTPPVYAPPASTPPASTPPAPQTPAPPPAPCRSCGHTNSPRARFCSQCGARLEAQTYSNPAQPPAFQGSAPDQHPPTAVMAPLPPPAAQPAYPQPAAYPPKAYATAPAARPSRPAQTRGKRPLLWAAAGLGAVLLALVLFLFLRGGGGSSAATPLAGVRLPDAPITAENAARIEKIGSITRGRVYQAAWSADSSTLAVVTLAGVETFNRDLHPSGVVKTDQPLLAAGLSSNGALLATQDGEGVVTVWKRTGGQWKVSKQMIEKVSMASELPGLSFSANSQKLAVVSAGDTLYIMDIGTGGVEQMVDIRSGQLPTYAPTGNRIGLGGGGENPFLVNPDTGEKTSLNSGRAGCDTALAFSTDGRQVSCFARGDMPVWDVETGQLVRSFTNPTSQQLSLGWFSPEGRGVGLSGSSPSDIHWVKLPSGQALSAFDNQVPPNYSNPLSPDGQRFLAIDLENALVMWDFEKGRLIATEKGFFSSYFGYGDYRFLLSPDGQQLFTDDRDLVQVWDPRTGGLLRAMLRPAAAEDENAEYRIGGMALDQAGTRLAVSYNNNSNGASEVIVWNAGDGKLEKRYQRPGIGVGPLVYRPDGKLLAVATDANQQFIQDVETGQQLFPLPSNRGVASFSPEGKKLFNSYNSQLVALDSQTGTVTGSWGAAQPFNKIAISPDSSHIALLGQDGVEILDANGQQPIELNAGNVQTAAFSPDGNLLLLGDYSTLQLWDWQKGNLLQSLSAGGAPSIAFAPDGKVIYAFAYDGIAVWGVP